MKKVINPAANNFFRHVSYGVIPIFKDADGYKYLLLRNNGGYWGFPKGHMETGESPKDTAIREAFEETSIKIDSDQLSFSVEYSYVQPIDDVLQTKTIVLFPVVTNSKKVRLQTSEIQSHQWASFNEAVSLVNLPGFTKALRQVEKRIVN